MEIALVLGLELKCFRFNNYRMRLDKIRNFYGLCELRILGQLSFNELCQLHFLLMIFDPSFKSILPKIISLNNFLNIKSISFKKTLLGNRRFTLYIGFQHSLKFLFFHWTSYVFINCHLRRFHVILWNKELVASILVLLVLFHKVASEYSIFGWTIMLIGSSFI